MQEPPRWPREAWLPLIAGLGWLWVGAQGTVLDFFVCLVPGILLLASGVAELLWAGDRRIVQFAALGGVLGGLAMLEKSPGLFGLPFAALLITGVRVAQDGLSARTASRIAGSVPRPAGSSTSATRVGRGIAGPTSGVSTQRGSFGSPADMAARATRARTASSSAPASGSLIRR